MKTKEYIGWNVTLTTSRIQWEDTTVWRVF